MVKNISRVFGVVLTLIAARVADAQTVKVACVGDSITALPSSWCGTLSTKLGSGYMVMNFGVSGTNLAKNVSQPYWSSAQYTPSHAFAPNIVVIMLGTNDAFDRSWPSAKDHFVADYEELLDTYTSLASRPKPYIIIPTPIGTSPFGHDGKLLETDVIPLIKQVAMEKMVPSIDGFSLFGGAMFDSSLYGTSDQVHPNAEGQMKLGEAVYRALMDTGALGGPASAGSGASAGTGGMPSAAGATAQAGSSANTGTAGAAMAGARATGGAGGGAGSTSSNAAAGSVASAGSATAGSNTLAGSTSSVGAAGSGNAGSASSVNGIGVAGSMPVVPAQASSDDGGCRTAGNRANGSGPTAAFVLLLGLALRRRKRLGRRAVREAASALAVLTLWACSSDDNSSDALSTPTGGTAAVTGSAGTATGIAGVAGSSRSSAAAGGSVAGHAGGAAGTTVVGAAGATPSAGAAGTTVATAGTPATATAGATAPTAGASGGAAAAAGAPASARPLASTLKLATMKESHAVAPFFNIWRPTDLTKVEGKLPIFVWNNGACSRNDAVFKPLFDKWASGGWIILSLTSGGGGSSTTQADHKALVDWVVAEATKDGSPYKDKLDLDHITAGGNSCGGITALGLAAADKRVTAVWVLSGSTGMGGANTMVTNAIKIPVAFMCGGTEDIARANLEADYAAFGAGIPALMVERSSGDHLTLSNLSGDIGPQAAEVSLNWLDLTTYGLQPALDALNAPTVCTGCMSGLWKMTSKNLETLVKK